MHCVVLEDGGREVVVGKIVCVGRNYAAHVEEMGCAPDTPPVLFLKPATALLAPGDAIRLPDFSSEIHHEVEMVALVGRRIQRASPGDAIAAVAGFGVGLDLTARDVQAESKARGGPWETAKGFDGSAPMSAIRAAAVVGDVSDLAIELCVNGEARQSSRTSAMLHALPDLLAHASRFFTLEPGDLFFTGTPEGVGPIRPGDVLEARLESVAEARWEVVARGND
jgi:2-keto-4-pentenoate hydratase/2-oxohepta-3-ene-1,7-dioic acid hydratase in catechol pathway